MFSCSFISTFQDLNEYDIIHILTALPPTQGCASANTIETRISSCSSENAFTKLLQYEKKI